MGCLIGLDIGGTKCAVSVGEANGDQLRILAREAMATPKDQSAAMDQLCAMAERLYHGQKIDGVGISAGGPLDAETGMLQNPPNLPGWQGLSLTQRVGRQLLAPCTLENDANACALAEWRWGAGKGSRVMAFLTFGTGLGAGIVIDGKILRGVTGDAGELGHWRLANYGPSGYGKIGSFEGFCSGGGIRQLAQLIGEQYRQRGVAPAYWGAEPMDARAVAQAARAGDPAACEVFTVCGEMLGRGLAILVDFLNPDCVVLGSIFARSGDLLTQPMQKTLTQEALPRAVRACTIVPAMLGDSIGDYAALALAAEAASCQRG